MVGAVGTLAGLRLAAGGEVTVLDLSEGAVAQDLVGMARGLGVQPLVWVLPGDLPRFDLGAGLPGDALADLLRWPRRRRPIRPALAGRARPGGRRATDPAQDSAILERIAGVLGTPAAQRRPAGRRLRGSRRSVIRATRPAAGCSARRRPRRSPGCTAGPPPTGS